ncbi:MAG: ParB N-terminal domain-containing protein [Alphaproteobacteria bacterium]|jgi:hypothetical protein|nr:ParB N-terminal domain-containing protein [Alphaproteobacteria bacterium]
MDNENEIIEEKYGILPDMDWLPIEQLIIDGTYQRDIKGRRSENNIIKIMETFSWSKFAPLTVNDNQNGTFSVIDGQHRLEAIKRLGDIKNVPCYIIPGETIQQQAKTFTETNQNRVCVNNFDLYKAKLASGDKEAVRLNDFCLMHDLIVSPNGSIPNRPNIVLAINTFKKLLRTNRENDLDFAVGIIKQAFPALNGQYRSDLVVYLADANKKYGTRFNRQAIINALRISGNADMLHRKAVNARSIDRSISHQSHYERILNNEYNRQYKLLKAK